MILKDLLNLSENKVTIDLIQTIVCKFFKISKNEMLSPRRSRYLVRPRQTAIYLAKILTSKSLPEIGRAFSNRDHTTVIHSVKTIDKLRKEDNELNINIGNLKNKILYNQENEIKYQPTGTSKIFELLSGSYREKKYTSNSFKCFIRCK